MAVCMLIFVAIVRRERWIYWPVLGVGIFNILLMLSSVVWICWQLPDYGCSSDFRAAFDNFRFQIEAQAVLGTATIGIALWRL